MPNSNLVEKVSCTDKELEFLIFLINKLSRHFNVTTRDVYAKLSESGILDDYLIKHYDVLHTLGEQHLIEDISTFLTEKGFGI